MDAVRLEWTPTKKQKEAFEYLKDTVTTELFYGGAAGGGKSYLGCLWVAWGCLKYPGSRWLIGRAVLKHLKSSTLLTFFDVLRGWGLQAETDYRYSQGDGTISFFNSSVVFLRELGADPSDPEFDKLGSTEYTGVFIDECSQISTKAKNIVMSRIRYKLEEYKLVPKMLMCSNPTKNFLYYDFYKPWKEGKLVAYRRFIPALVTDNPFVSPHYVANLHKLDKVSKERLLFGNFEYDDDPSRLFEYDDILDLFTNSFVRKDADDMFLSVDVARFGTDKTIIILWKGHYADKFFSYEKKDTAWTAAEIERLRAAHSIPRSRVVIDEDGIGGGVVDQLPGVKGFVNNSRAYDHDKTKAHETQLHNYGNLKAQCYYALADWVKRKAVGVTPDLPVELRTRLIEDLEQIKRKDPDKDGRLFVTPKEDVKEMLGRSPDCGDALMMRMFFDVAQAPKLVFSLLDVTRKPLK